MKRLVVFDIDGVVADFEGQLVRALLLEFGSDALADRSLFGLEERYEGEVLLRAKSLTADPNFYYPLPAISGGVSLAKQVLESGMEITFISSRPRSVQTYTERWLKKYLEAQDGYFVECGISDKKSFIYEATKYTISTVAFVVEDNPDNIYAIKELGIQTLCWGQVWNEGIFPRLYERSDGEIMLWEDASIESAPFVLEETEEN